MAEQQPRITPGGPSEIGRLNYMLARAIGAATGTGPLNIFTTLGRHRGLFRRWLIFAGALMPGGKLPRKDTELVILRVAHNTGCDYEWDHHERLGQLAGLTIEDIHHVREAPHDNPWPPRQQLLLRAADEMHSNGSISAELWSELRPIMSDVELIELCMLIGHYEMLAMTLNSLGVQRDPAPGRQPRLVRALARAGASR